MKNIIFYGAMFLCLGTVHGAKKLQKKKLTCNSTVKEVLEHLESLETKYDPGSLKEKKEFCLGGTLDTINPFRSFSLQSCHNKFCKNLEICDLAENLSKEFSKKFSKSECGKTCALTKKMDFHIRENNRLNNELEVQYNHNQSNEEEYEE